MRLRLLEDIKFTKQFLLDYAPKVSVQYNSHNFTIKKRPSFECEKDLYYSKEECDFFNKRENVFKCHVIIHFNQLNKTAQIYFKKYYNLESEKNMSNFKKISWNTLPLIQVPNLYFTATKLSIRVDEFEVLVKDRGSEISEEFILTRENLADFKSKQSIKGIHVIVDESLLDPETVALVSINGPSLFASNDYNESVEKSLSSEIRKELNGLVGFQILSVAKNVSVIDGDKIVPIKRRSLENLEDSSSDLIWDKQTFNEINEDLQYFRGKHIIIPKDILSETSKDAFNSYVKLK